MIHRDVALRGAAIGLAAALAGLVCEAIAAGTGGWSWVLAALVALAVGAGGGYLALYRSARAVHDVSVAAEQVAEGDLEQRVHDAPGPVYELTHAFNAMAGRIQQLFDGIAAEQARLEAVFDASTDAMVALSRDTRVRFLNPAAVQVLGGNMTSAIGRPFIETARDYELDALVRQAVAAPKEPHTSVITFGPNRIPLHASAVPIPNGGDWAVLLLLTDLTEVQRVDQVRRDFVSNVSHELRTPLASIRALIETIEEGAVDAEDQAEFLARIRQQVDRLTVLVNELLDLSRIESGAIELQPESVALGEVIAEAASLLRTRIEPLGITIECPAREEGVVEADRASLLRVVSNLLDNAIKYSPPGAVIHVTVADEGALVAVHVRDEGPGIPEPELPRVFERFYKGEQSRANAGTGLGLAIVKHLVRAHGGTASASSRPGQGAEFTVRLPKRFVGRSKP